MDVKLPSLGEGADSGVIVSLLVKEGDSIEEGQTILELENEKAVAPIPSPAAGRIQRILVKPGDRISVGTAILRLGDPSHATAQPATPSQVAAVSPKPAPATPATTPAPGASASPPAAIATPLLEPLPDAPPPPASPAVRKIAADLGIDLRRVRGSMPGGRIIMDDLRAYVRWLINTAHAAPPAAPTANAANNTAASRPTPPTPPIDFAVWGPIVRKSLSPLRTVISRRMSESWHAVPRVTQFEEVDVTDLMGVRKRHADAYQKRNANLTVTCCVLKALAATLKNYPQFNSSLDESTQELVLKSYYHIGIAVDTDAGLLVPVLRDVDRKSILEIALELGSIATRARERKIAADEMKGGSFTLSNQGAIGGGHFTPIINLPEVAILGLGRGTLKPAVIDNTIQPRTLLPIALSYDHRVIDGAAAARFILDLSKAISTYPESEIRL